MAIKRILNNAKIENAYMPMGWRTVASDIFFSSPFELNHVGGCFSVEGISVKLYYSERFFVSHTENTAVDLKICCKTKSCSILFHPNERRWNRQKKKTAKDFLIPLYLYTDFLQPPPLAHNVHMYSPVTSSRHVEQSL